MRHIILLALLSSLSACSSNKDKNNPLAYSYGKQFSFDDQPAKSILDFLKWYRDNRGEIGCGYVNNVVEEENETKGYYSVNFDSTEKYLADLKSTGFISEKYINHWREYFRNCEINFKDHPSNDGPPAGFEYDFVMLSQEFEEDLENLDKLKIVSQSLSSQFAEVKIEFESGYQLLYQLSRNADKWEIDHIERGN